jgi:hypothetical protein
MNSLLIAIGDLHGHFLTSDNIKGENHPILGRRRITHADL